MKRTGLLLLLTLQMSCALSQSTSAQAPVMIYSHTPLATTWPGPATGEDFLTAISTAARVDWYIGSKFLATSLPYDPLGGPLAGIPMPLGGHLFSTTWKPEKPQTVHISARACAVVNDCRAKNWIGTSTVRYITTPGPPSGWVPKGIVMPTGLGKVEP